MGIQKKIISLKSYLKYGGSTDWEIKINDFFMLSIPYRIVKKIMVLINKVIIFFQKINCQFFEYFSNSSVINRFNLSAKKEHIIQWFG